MAYIIGCEVAAGSVCLVSVGMGCARLGIDGDGAGMGGSWIGMDGDGVGAAGRCASAHADRRSSPSTPSVGGDARRAMDGVECGNALESEDCDVDASLEKQ
mmetsp:Transcript_33764/g.74084  ORF Transcript_33764/g.74084 Transcript_33764/m.74084 type:complete len:101 (-) Transcript_33764:828-1130(-)